MDPNPELWEWLLTNFNNIYYETVERNTFSIEGIWKKKDFIILNL